MGLHLLIRAILGGKCDIEHVAEDDRGQKQTGIFHLTLEIGVVINLGSWWSKVLLD